ncbi:MAG: hypothetical protein ACI4UX_02435 [Clostridia bacterium]
MAFGNVASDCKIYVPYTEEEGLPSGWASSITNNAEIIYAESATE